MIIRFRSQYGLNRLKNIEKTMLVSDLYKKVDEMFLDKGLSVKTMYKDILMSRPIYKSQQTLETHKIW